MRKLVTKRYIGDIQPILGADAIEVSAVDGWEVVVKKGEFSIGDPCVFFEIDSFLPADDERFAFLLRTGVKKDPSGRERIRLKTVKLRKQLSQGLALPFRVFPELRDLGEDEDGSELIDVIKYERPEPSVANASGNFPEILRKTDEDRIQNKWAKYSDKYHDMEFVPTLKLDGSSCTVAVIDAERYEGRYKGGEENAIQFKVQNGLFEIIVCSRNLQLKVDPESHFWKGLQNSGVIEALKKAANDFNYSIAVQGEVMGPGIQGNKDKFNDYCFYAFNVFDIERQSYTGYKWSLTFFENYGIPDVPVIEDSFKPFQHFLSLQELLEYADGPSINAKYREGVVFKSVKMSDPVSFKVISNKFLLKGGDD